MPRRSKASRRLLTRGRKATIRCSLPPVPEDLEVISWSTLFEKSCPFSLNSNAVGDSGSRGGSSADSSCTRSSSTVDTDDGGRTAVAQHGSQQQQQQQQQQQPATLPQAQGPPKALLAASLPVSSLTRARLLAAVPPTVGLPPLQPGELRLCGLTFHPSLAPGVRRAMADWEAGLGPGGLARADPARHQIGLGLAEALIQRYRVRPLVLADYLGKYLGMAVNRAAPLPAGVLELQGVEAASEGQLAVWQQQQGAGAWGGRCRGGVGLRASRPIRRSHPLGVMGGYVLPVAEAKELVHIGFGHCSPEVMAELEAGAVGMVNRVKAWRMLVRSHLLPLQGLGSDVHGEGAAGPGPEAVLWMLGYGNLGALVNDPRVDPRAWQEGNDVEGQVEGQGQGQGQADGKAESQGQGQGNGGLGAPVGAEERLHRGANCAVLPVSVRGLVLPVLVALRDIAEGEELLRDYGADWWRGISDTWKLAKEFNRPLAMSALAALQYSVHSTESSGKA